MRLGTSDDTSVRFTVQRLTADIVQFPVARRYDLECHENRCRLSSYRATGRFEYRERVGAIRFKQRQFPTDNGWRVGLQGDKELENQKKVQK